MARLIQGIVVGLGNGAIYALLALAFVTIYKSTRVLNFALPALMVAGGVTVSYLAAGAGMGYVAAVGVAVVSTALLAVVLEWCFVRPMRGAPVFIVAIITLGIDIVLRVVVNRFIGATARQVGDPWGIDAVMVLGTPVQERYLWFPLIALVIVVALLAFFTYTRAGLAMRATSFDQEAAQAQGISVRMVFTLSWAIAGALVAVAGALIGTGSGINQTTWVAALKALPAIILGGLESIGGAIIGGLVVGLVEALVGTYQADYAPWLGNNFAVVSPYVIMLLVLLVRPYGLFGTPDIERV
jgi:branched-chain amino acid transport system permease protein